MNNKLLFDDIYKQLKRLNRDLPQTSYDDFVKHLTSINDAKIKELENKLNNRTKQDIIISNSLNELLTCNNKTDNSIRNINNQLELTDGKINGLNLEISHMEQELQSIQNHFSDVQMQLITIKEQSDAQIKSIPRRVPSVSRPISRLAPKTVPNTKINKN